MKSPKEINLESKILNKLKNFPDCIKLVQYLFNDEELQAMQDYANNVSIKRLGFNDHGLVQTLQVALQIVVGKEEQVPSAMQTSRHTMDVQEPYVIFKVH